MPPKNVNTSDRRGPRPSTRAYDDTRAQAAFPSDAYDEFTRMLSDSHAQSRRRRTQAEVDDAVRWFNEPSRAATTAKEQSDRNWWKSTFRFSPGQNCLFALPTKKYRSERRVVPEEDYFRTIVYEHDINGPGKHQMTAQALLEYYYGPTRKETVHLLKRCLVCGKGLSEGEILPDAEGEEASHVLSQVTHGNQHLEGVPRFETYPDKRQWMLQHLAGVCRWLDSKGYCEGLLAHVSLRDCEPVHHNAMWMNPMGVPMAMVNTSNLICLDMDTGNRVGPQSESNSPISSPGFLLHQAIYKARPDTMAIIYGSSENISAFAALGKQLDMLTHECCVFFESHSIHHGYGGPLLTDESTRRVIPSLGEKRACLLKNFGCVIVGSTIDEVAMMFHFLDKSCKAQLLVDKAEASNASRSTLSDGDAKYNAQILGDSEYLYAAFQLEFRLLEIRSQGEF